MTNKILLRKLIKEMINETPFMDVLPAPTPAYKDDDHPIDRARYQREKKTVERFHNTPLFRAKAKAAFKHFPFDIYIMPVVTSWDYPLDFGTGVGNIESHRTNVIKAGEVFKELKELNDPGIPFDKLESIINSGGTIILNIIPEEGMESGLLPTPWMIVHAMYDDDVSLFKKYMDKIVNIFKKHGLTEDDLDEIQAWMTTRSAQNREITTLTDAAAEMLTQETITTQGMQFKDPPNGNMGRWPKWLQEIFKWLGMTKIRKTFADRINQRGKFIAVRTGVDL